MPKPEELLLIDCYESAREEAFRKFRNNNKIYQDFIKLFYEKPHAADLMNLREKVEYFYDQIVELANGTLSDRNKKRGEGLTKYLKGFIGNPPDRIIVADDNMSKQTYQLIVDVWGNELKKVPCIYESSLRTIDCGLIDLYYGDLAYFMADKKNKQQRVLYEDRGYYNYTYPQGGSLIQAEDRVKFYYSKMCKEFSSRDRVWIIADTPIIVLFITIIEDNVGPDYFKKVWNSMGLGGGFSFYTSRYNKERGSGMDQIWEFRHACTGI